MCESVYNYCYKDFYSIQAVCKFLVNNIKDDVRGDRRCNGNKSYVRKKNNFKEIREALSKDDDLDRVFVVRT